MTNENSAIIVGAGVSGLACARRLYHAGCAPSVLERSRGVGGRCATRTLPSGQVADHGINFLHGSEPTFQQELAAVPHPVRLWPQHVMGKGPACVPEAFMPSQQRIAFAAGVNVFPQHLARDLHVALEHHVTEVQLEGHGWRVVLENGTVRHTPALILALAIEQQRTLLAGVAQAPKAIQGMRYLLEGVASAPCCTLIASYPISLAPSWDMWYPEKSKIIQLVSHDSRKRENPQHTVLVLQSRACWAQAQAPLAHGLWQADLLAEAARLLGDWAAQPATCITHAWRYGRPMRGSEFSRPVLSQLPSGQFLGLTGDVFFPGANIQSAWLAGDCLGQQLCERMAT